MDPKAYDQMAQVEDVHWWFVARRRVLGPILQGLNLPPQAQILEAGCGSGGNLAMLAAFGSVCAMELSDSARQKAQARGIGVVQEGKLPQGIPFQGQRFDLIALLDVLEHLDEDVEALKALGSRLAPNGRLLLTVPANPWLWSRHDTLNHHKRRYTKRGLEKVLTTAGFQIHNISYFNTLLFPLIAGIRLLQKALKVKDSDDLTMPSSLVNRTLGTIFAWERFLVNRIPMPFGVSLVLVASVKGDPSQH